MHFYRKNDDVYIGDILGNATNILILFHNFSMKYDRQKAHSDRAGLQLENNSTAATTGIVSRVDNLELRWLIGRQEQGE